MHQTSTRYAPDKHTVCTRQAQGMQQTSTRYAPDKHKVCFWRYIPCACLVHTLALHLRPTFGAAYAAPNAPEQGRVSHTKCHMPFTAKAQEACLKFSKFLETHRHTHTHTKKLDAHPIFQIAHTHIPPNKDPPPCRAGP
jgi:hypothetical protein